MANTYTLGGSPLGLIGVKSRPNDSGDSTFNGGKSRNINVSAYNLGDKQTTSLIRGGKNVYDRVSLFSGLSLPKFWGNISTFGTDGDTGGVPTIDKNGNTIDPYKGINRTTLHNNHVYDTSILNIIESLSFSSKAALRPQDFAYLKNLGVFPNNRLMIARKFTSPQADNIMGKGGPSPLAVLISWKPQEEEFLDFSFGEEWTDAEADFTNVLNKLGENFGISGGGSGSGKGLNVVPLPGFTETIQRKLLIGLGILADPSKDKDGNTIETEKVDVGFKIDVSNQPLPSGNPNIIKVAKRRKTIGYGEAGSGLKASININMKVEYEQKFISGIDPTIAWMDLLNNALIFGTSNSDNYGLNPDFVKKINSWTGPGGVKILIDEIVTLLKNTFSDAIKDIGDFVGNLVSPPAEEAEVNSKAVEDALKNVLTVLYNSVEDAVRKYKVEIMGIAHALSGVPSTPWHVTIGNPLRPVFCSGDMLVDDVKVKMGSSLAFNDLPSTMIIEFSMKNARPLGLQELLAKFNTGYLRVVNVRKDYLISSPDDGDYYDNNQTALTPAPAKDIYIPEFIKR